jgi:hypothetical protein
VHELWHSSNQSSFSQDAVLWTNFSYTGYGDDITSDGPYTLMLEYPDASTADSDFLFFVPGTMDPLSEPMQEPVIFDPVQSSLETSPVSFAWSTVTDSNVNLVRITSTNLFEDLDIAATTFGPIDMTAGNHEFNVFFRRAYTGLFNADGVPYEISKSRSKRHTWTVVNEDQYTLDYYAGFGGSLVGITPQTVLHGANGSAVFAQAEADTLFGGWSDGTNDNPRTELNVTNDLSVTATFTSPAGVPLDWYEDNGLFPGEGETWADVDDGDADEDLDSNATEYFAGTDPNDAGDQLRITNLIRFPGVIVQFNSSTGRLYKLTRSDQPTSNIWQGIMGMALRPGAGGPDSFSDPTAPESNTMYRIESELP